MTNKNSVTVQVVTFGARVVSMTVPDRYGKITDVILGCDNVAGQTCVLKPADIFTSWCFRKDVQLTYKYKLFYCNILSAALMEW